MFPPEDQASRRAITEMMVSNVSNSIVDVPGTFYMPRRESIVDLIRRDLGEPRYACLIIGDVPLISANAGFGGEFGRRRLIARVKGAQRVAGLHPLGE